MTEFLKFENSIGRNGEVSSTIRLPEKQFKQVEAALKPLGITFRSPRR